MSERFIRIFNGNNDLCVDDSPVVIRACVLLKDTATEQMLAQLKLQNFSGKRITYVKVLITPFDAIKKPLGAAIEFEYLDINIADRSDFGSKRAIPMPSASTRSFHVGVSSVAFADGSVWYCDNTEWQTANPNSEIAKKISAEKTYAKLLPLIESNDKSKLNNAIKGLEEIRDYKIVEVDINICKNKIERINKAEMAKRQQEIERVQEIEKQKASRKKALKRLPIIVGICVVVILTSYFAIYPLLSYVGGNYSVYINMYGITEFEVPKGVTSIGNDAFYECDNLTSITIPDGVTSIGFGAFYYCANLESITIPDSVTSIGYGAFSNCANLESITFGENSKLSSIDGYAFADCKNLESINIPDGVTYIGAEAFENCKNLESINIPDSVESFYDSVFRGCGNIKHAIVPASAIKLLKGNIDMQTIVITSGTIIDAEAFSNYSKLKNVTLPDGLIYIEWRAFNKCSSLTSITIPESVQSIGGEAFFRCENLTTINFEGTKAQWVAIDKGLGWNSYTGDYIIHCTDGDIIKPK